MEKFLPLKKILFFLIALGLFAYDSHAQDNTTTFDSNDLGSNNFVVPAGQTYVVTIQVWGAGGAGGRRTNNGGSGGGGGGAYSRSTVTLTAGTYKAFVGTGGSGNSNNPSDGGDSYFTNNAGTVTYARAKGGLSVDGNTTSGGAGGSENAGDAVGDVKYSGGNGVNGVSVIAVGYGGGGGASAGTGADGPNGLLTAGGNAGTGGGDGGNGASYGNNPGSNASNPGGGGGGAYRSSSGNRNGGNGGAGQVIITWFNQEINVQGNGANILDGGSGTPSLTNDTNFGAAYIFGGSVTKTFTIYNTGGATLTLSTPTIAGTNATDFTIVTAPVSPVLSGASTTFSVKFDPNGAGSRVATISFVNNDSNENPYNWNLSGTGNAYTDSDGDGVTDETDIDDDNDGVTDAIEQAGCTASPLATSVEHTFLNETFGNGTTYTEIDENITTATTTYSYTSSGDVNDGSYTVKNSAQITSWANDYWHRGIDHTGDTNGKMAIFNASFAAGTFYSTTITGLTANIPVKYSFWVLNLDRTDAPGIGTRIRPNVRVEFRRSSNNALITFLETGNIAPTINTTGAGSWYNFSSEFNAPETSIKVIFINNATGGLGNDLALDDILITQKYCDMDNDGDADIFDLDDDNDGIPDIVEAGLRSFSANKSKMDISNPAIWKDVNGNGMNDAVDTLISNGTYTTLYVKDTDGDGVRDIFDVDSDNDSIFDIDEAQTDTFSAYYNGDGDVDGDGRGDGADVDNDGIKDINDDNISVYGTNNKAYPVDTDGDGTPNYLDLTSNGGTTKDIAGTIYASLDGNNDGKIDGSTDVDKDGILDSFDGDTGAIGSPRNITTKKLLIDFDGRNDYAESVDLLGGLSKATIMGWIKLDASFTNAAVVMGQDNFNISVNASRQLVATAKGTSITFTTTPLSVSRWYHVAAVYEGAGTKKLILYLNGTELLSSNAGGLAGSLAASSFKFTIAKNAASSTNYFRGFIDEVRVFTTALLPEQLNTMVCQEIDINGAKVRGATISKDLDGVTGTTNWSTAWADLSAYFRFDNYKGDVIDDYKTNSVIDSGSSTTLARIYNVKYLKDQTVVGAPMPFVTTANGAIDTNDATNVITNAAGFIYGPDAKNYPAAIIQVKHNVTSSNNLTQVGLIVDAGKTVTMNNDTKIENTWFLNLQGKIDLQGKSQLIQTTNSTTASTTTGSLERDQQGTKNIYNYNYWSSPVSTINNSTVNNGYTVSGVLKDGTSSNFQNITWTDSYDGAATTPITLSRNWVYKYQNDATNWSYVGETGSVLAGQGFTLKGSGAASTTQNYTFIGKPNNGTISVPVTANNLSLVGNPYPSAISAFEFIRDNITPGNVGSSNVILGTLYFWEHSALNNTHTYADYQGGYAVRNLIGGLPPVVATGTSGLGGNTREPYLYIPVGQAFFVEGSASGGNVNFKNSQRGFQKEDGGNSNIMFRASSTMTEVNNNANDPIVADTFKKIRIGFDSNENFHRQLLIGFMDENATDGFDPGYDAGNFDDNPSDMYFVNDSKKLVIQGVGSFYEGNKYQLGVKNAINGPVKFTLDDTENVDEDQDIFIYDAVTGQHHSIKDQDFEITLDAGTYEERFSLRFTNQALGIEDPTLSKNIEIVYSNSDELLTIVNNLSDATIQTASIFNILGQQVAIWDLSNQSQQKIEIPVKNLSAGTYIVKVETDKNSLTKKIGIR